MTAPAPSGGPEEGSPGGHRPWRRARWLRELAAAAVLYLLYDLIHGAITGRATQADRDGRDLLHWETIVHLDPEHALNADILHVPVVAVPFCYFYATLHFIVTPAVLVWTYRRHRGAYPRARTTLAVTTLAALVGFRWFPTAPPRLLPHAGFADTLAHYRAWGWWGTDASVPAAARAIANQFAAMPSLHVAWACWCAATVFALTRRRWLRVTAVAYPLLTALVVLATANHYLLDVLAGAALWFLATVAVRAAGDRARRFGRSPAPAADPR